MLDNDIILAKDGDEEAICRVIESMMPCIYKFSKSYKGRELEYEDFVSLGKIGVMIAINKFDFTKNTKFSSYAYLWIRQQIGRACEKDRPLKHTLNIVRKEIEYRNYISEYEKSNGRVPSDEEIMEYMDINNKQLDELKDICSSMYDYSKTTIGTNKSDPYNNIEYNYDLSVLNSVVDKLCSTDKKILEMKYSYNKTNRMIANELGLPISYVIEREKKLLLNMKEQLLDNGVFC